MRRWIYRKMSDETLMRLYGRGDAKAFDLLYRRYKDKLYHFLYRQCSQHTIAEELAHDAWLAVIRRSADYQATAQFNTWLYRIAHYRLVDYWRKYGSNASVLMEELKEASLHSKDTATHGLELEDLLQSLQSLPEAQIETLLLKIEGFTRAEIANVTGAKPETVKSRLRYASNQLRAAMEMQA
jgi:RNA polymerase sigma-70 factor (ECF subfamily)